MTEPIQDVFPSALYLNDRAEASPSADGNRWAWLIHGSTETHAVVNRSFTRVYLNTDSGSCGIDAEVMLIELPYFS